MAAPNGRKREKFKRLKPIEFGEHPGPEPFNASEIAAIADSRFLFCDNNIGDGLFELRLTPDGSMAGPLIRRQLSGIEPGTVDDLECMVLVEARGRRFLILSPSLSLKRAKGNESRGKISAARSCLLRVSLNTDDQLAAEVMPDFRRWLVGHAPLLVEASTRLPDDGGLNVEGLAWSSADEALLLGMRTPVIEGRPLILRVRVKQIDGPWELSNLEMLSPVSLAITTAEGEQGIRSIQFDPVRGVLLIVAGNSTSASKAPFTLMSWDGNAQGRVRHFEEVCFHKKMKIEGVTPGRIDGRGAIVFVDDAGGYQFLWDDDPRLKQNT